jgi:hypothetical protein
MAFNYAILLLAIHVTVFSRIGNRQYENIIGLWGKQLIAQVL